MHIGIVGATGMVGLKILEVLEERDLAIDKISLFASARSEGKQIPYKDTVLVVEALNESIFEDKNLDVLFFAAGGSISEKYIPIALKHHIRVIDNSSFYRMDANTPLVVPEINGDLITDEVMLVANPNCSTTQSVLPLKVIDDLFGLKRVVYTTFQAVSGAGQGGVNDLLSGEPKQFKHNIQKNVLPEIDVFLENGYTKEEMKMIEETRKILGLENLPVTATAVRVPIINTHAISINVEVHKAVDLNALKDAFNNQPGIVYMNGSLYPLAEMVDGTDDVYVGRLRLDPSVEHGLNFWCVADNIRKGAATNTVQILEKMI